MQKLSKREKVLLYVLLLALLVLGSIYLLIIPIANSYSEMNTLVGELQQQVLENRIAIAGMEGNEAAIEEYTARIEELQGLLPPAMHNDEADHLVTALLTQHHLAPQSLAIADVQLVQVAPQGVEVDEDAAPMYPQILRTMVQAGCTGSMADAVALADSLKDSNALQLAHFSAEADLENEELYTFVLTFYINMDFAARQADVQPPAENVTEDGTGNAEEV